MPFDSPDYDLTELLKDVGSGKIQLPDFQRLWKWDDDRIASLLASIALGYPVGVIMLLQLGDDGVRFAPTPIAGVDGGSVHSPEFLLLDGQQRLTSLYQALSWDQPVDTTDARGKRMRRWYYVDISKALDPEGDIDEAILSVPDDRMIREDFGRQIVADYSTTETECEAEVFPLRIVFDQGTIFDWAATYTGLSPERVPRWKSFLQQVLNNFVHYKLPAIVLTKETPKEAVCTVFEKVNTGGVPLNVFELLTATFAADNFRLKDDWSARKAKLDQRPVLRSVESTDVLQAVSLLATRARRLAFDAGGEDGVAPGISCKRKDVLRLSLAEYQAWADAVTDAFDWAATFLAQERVFRSQDIPYRTQLVPLAVIRVVLGAEADGYVASKKLRQWYWCGVLGELYGGTIETRFARDLEQVVPWIQEDGPSPGTVVEATFRAARLLTLRTRNSAAYKGLYALLMRSECLDWLKNQPLNMATFFDYHVDVHHVFPKAWCEKNGIEHSRCESIVNKTALSFATNRSIGGRSPTDYVPTLERQSGLTPAQLDELLATHLIDPAHLRAGDFDGFFWARTEALLGLVAEAMGKEPVRDDVTGEGDVGAFEEEPEGAEHDLPLAAPDEPAETVVA